VTNAAPPVRVLYVGGMPRSGSTLIDLAIGQLPRHVAVGELFYLWTAGVQRNLRCGCGEHFYDCPFWTEVGRRTFGSWTAVDRDEISRLRARVDATRSLPSLLHPGRDNDFARDLESYTRILTRLYAAILEVSGAEFVVDSSKRPSLAYVLEQAPNIDLRIAHVVRDPRGVAFSWQKTVELPKGNTAKTHMPKWSPLKTSRRWVTVNGLIARVARRVPSVTVRYEDFVQHPRREIGRVAALTGVADVPGALDFITEEGLLPASHHTVQGGRIRFQEGPIRLRADEQWRSEMPTWDRRFVSAATWPTRTRYDYHSG
jgi:hypothetical protein